MGRSVRRVVLYLNYYDDEWNIIIARGLSWWLQIQVEVVEPIRKKIDIGTDRADYISVQHQSHAFW